VEQYLRRYAVPESNELAELPVGFQWTQVVVIPACNETAGFLREPPLCDGRILLILVINETSGATPEVSTANRTLAGEVDKRHERIWQSASGLTLYGDPEERLDVLLVDRFSDSRKLPAKGGVGHARKIGADLATRLISDGRVQSRWIHCTDADARLPAGYFRASASIPMNGRQPAALIYPFQHVDNDIETAPCDQEDGDRRKVIQATQLYECSLRYYVAGLRFARSPFAFHTIGSTMAVNAGHYASVRGFPRRQAGEDFYLLNKLAKVAPVVNLSTHACCGVIEIESRRSDRVPFGTGAAVGHIATMADPWREFLFYNPVVFVLLGHWLAGLPALWREKATDPATILARPGAEPSVTAQFPKALEAMLEWLQKNGIGKALSHGFEHSADETRFIRHMNTWFDGFRTLKLIHCLRDQCLPSLAYGDLETNRLFRQLLNEDDELSSCHMQLLRALPQGNVESPRI
jgi:hypothetical protein